ncbi:eukaryotic-type carbonic anhydrase family protein (macronuclear) [Tetrahymena thermophila SB210]|uniref:Eukaryotic-type carbonic anhydrase family protein n=1 Tax=Tetrahymena thermophila (strain SB210) TaxID=312017 RepID=I7LZK0_TETTS|nr:eukaryotic-type carbonic anhydrase family protein [Tetrahymena thermophila SB210]EAR84075.1 eukaryotic-type carbonic anhydrase family protein [Tetrahymena thermophila SB210]|eukprot:XP_001031738.1 eukaryotic-type carbonic anhydrase family protein [Tetrahymena thermophila SB210]
MNQMQSEDNTNIQQSYNQKFLSNHLFDFTSKKQQNDNKAKFTCQDSTNQIGEDTSQKSLSSNSVTKKIQKQKKNKINQLGNHDSQQQVMRYCLTQVQKPIYTPYLFLFTGNVIIDFIDQSRESQIFNSLKPLTIQSLTKREDWFSAKPSFIDVCNEFDMAIYLLENKQSQIQYDIAQKMKQFKLFASKQTQIISKIKEKYNNNFEQLSDLKAERAKYRNDQIDNYIKANMKEDDFYICFDYGIDFQNSVTHPLFIKFSKSMFALFGIEEDYVHLFLTKKEAFQQMIPDISRKLLTLVNMQLLLQEDRYKKLIINGYQINTIEDFQISCDLEAYIQPITYPPNFEYIINSSDNLEDTVFIKFIITAQHIKNVLQQRQVNSNCPCFEDIEYSVFSEMFIQRFYPEEYNKQQNQQLTSQDTCQEVEIEEKNNEEEENTQKTCGYRFIQ